MTEGMTSRSAIRTSFVAAAIVGLSCLLTGLLFGTAAEVAFGVGAIVGCGLMVDALSHGFL